MGHIESKTGSNGQLLEKKLERSSRHSFYPFFMKLYQNVCHHLILTEFETGSCWVKNKVTRSDLGKKTSIHSRGQSFNPNFMKLCKNVYFHQIYVKLKTGSFGSKARS